MFWFVRCFVCTCMNKSELFYNLENKLTPLKSSRDWKTAYRFKFEFVFEIQNLSTWLMFHFLHILSLENAKLIKIRNDIYYVFFVYFRSAQIGLFKGHLWSSFQNSPIVLDQTYSCNIICKRIENACNLCIDFAFDIFCFQICNLSTSNLNVLSDSVT